MSSPEQALTHRFAWDGFSFDVPSDWNLSEYVVRREVNRVRMEDDAALRLELQWIRSARPVDPARFQDRYGQAAQRLAAEGARTTRVEDLPPDWSAFLYSMPEGNRLLTAFRMPAGDPLFCFFQLHFPAASLREPVRLIRTLAVSFAAHEGDLIPWACYDIGFRCPRRFRLVNTSFQAGRKLMVFEWGLRRLFVWHFSLADLMLKEKRLEAWCADFLNGFRAIRGPVFVPGRAGEVLTRHTWRYPVGHIEEWVRWCRRYNIRCDHISEKNQIRLVLFNHRRERDLEKPFLEPL